VLFRSEEGGGDAIKAVKVKKEVKKKEEEEGEDDDVEIVS
jgi:hypothetical protein